VQRDFFGASLWGGNSEVLCLRTGKKKTAQVRGKVRRVSPREEMKRRGQATKKRPPVVVQDIERREFGGRVWGRGGGNGTIKGDCGFSQHAFRETATWKFTELSYEKVFPGMTGGSESGNGKRRNCIKLGCRVVVERFARKPL